MSLDARQGPEEELRKFATHGLSPNDESLRKGIQLSRWIFDQIRKQTKYYIDRMKFGGTRIKETTIPSFDFDMVLYIVTNLGTNFPTILTEILREFELILSSLQNEKYQISDIYLTKKSVQFKVNGHDFNLIPARNFVKCRRPALKNMEYCEKQTIGTLKQIEDILSLNSPYATNLISQVYESSLYEYQANFMESQNTKAHELIRLCKFWNNSLAIDIDIPGREYIISLLAVATAKVTGGLCIIQSFHFFLYQISNFEYIDVKFAATIPGIISSLHVKPIIKDPANPYINLADNFSTEARQLFKEFSGETLRRLLEFEDQKDNLCSLESLFAPQPIDFVLNKETLTPLKHLLITIETKEIKFQTTNKPQIIYKKPVPAESFLTPVNIQIIGNRINTLVTTNTYQNSKDNLKHVIRDCIEKSIPVNTISPVSRAHSYVAKVFGREKKFRHEDSDVTYVIPYWIGSDKKSAMVSLKWIL